VQDSKDQGALDLLHAQMQSVIMAATGIIPGDNGGPVPPGPADASGNTPPAPGPGPVDPVTLQMQEVTAEGQAQMLTDLVTQAYGTKLGVRRMPSDT